MSSSIGCFVPSVHFKSSYNNARHIERDDLTLENVIKTFYKGDEIENLPAIIERAKGNKNSITEKDRKKINFNGTPEGHVIATVLSQYDQTKLRRVPGLYQAKKINGFWFVPVEIAENPPRETRGPKPKKGWNQ